MKNGYTSNAGNTFTGAATRGGRTLLGTVMHPESGSNAVYEETAALLDWGFGAGRSAQAVGTLVDPVSESGVGAAPTEKAVQAAAGARGAAAGGGSTWGVVGGAGGAVPLLAGAVYERRRRRRG